MINEDLRKKLEQESSKVASFPEDQPVNLVLMVGGHDIGDVTLLNKSLLSKRWDVVERAIELVEIENNIEHTAPPFEQLENGEINFRVEVKA